MLRAKKLFQALLWKRNSKKPIVENSSNSQNPPKSGAVVLVKLDGRAANTTTVTDKLNVVIQLGKGSAQARWNWGELIADGLTLAFLGLTLYHTQHILAEFEDAPVRILAWAVAAGIDTGIAFSAFSISNRELKFSTRWVAGVWLAGLLFLSYGLNVAYYSSQKNEGWSWLLAATFPVSLAFLGALKPGLAEAGDRKKQNRQIDALREVVEAHYQELVDPWREKLAALEEQHQAEQSRLRGELEQTRQELSAPDPAKTRLVEELEETKNRLVRLKQELEQNQEQNRRELEQIREELSVEQIARRDWEDKGRALEASLAATQTEKVELKAALRTAKTEAETAAANLVQKHQLELQRLRQQQLLRQERLSFPRQQVEGIMAGLYTPGANRIKKEQALELLQQLWPAAGIENPEEISSNLTDQNDRSSEGEGA